ncbi:hypothetical protein EYF80_055611 [Liparis tanakae]|uniref:Uncharacterized protein n=1 Tax=Liparis tanakae TaxID=230148 RepID=A0A4Z2EZ34_9TELE|nr:hypothetical protein EYF80_055611 [Liparis tanakae]
MKVKHHQLSMDLMERRQRGSVALPPLCRWIWVQRNRVLHQTKRSSEGAGPRPAYQELVGPFLGGFEDLPGVVVQEALQRTPVDGHDLIAHLHQPGQLCGASCWRRSSVEPTSPPLCRVSSSFVRSAGGGALWAAAAAWRRTASPPRSIVSTAAPRSLLKSSVQS